MSWEAAEKASKEVASGKFISLKNDGDKVIVAFLGDPVWKDSFFDPKTNKSIPYTDEHKKAGINPSRKFKVNVYVPLRDKDRVVHGGAGKMHIFECNPSTFNDIMACKHKYGLDAKFFEIVRSGVKGDTKTTYKVLPDVDIKDEDRAIIKGLALHDLEKSGNAEDEKSDLESHGKKNGATEASAPAPTPAASVISADDAKALVPRIKVQPKGRIDEFLKKFEITQIKALKASDLPAALAMLDAWEGKTSAEPAAPDPFA